MNREDSSHIFTFLFLVIAIGQHSLTMSVVNGVEYWHLGPTPSLKILGTTVDTRGAYIYFACLTFILQCCLTTGDHIVGPYLRTQVYTSNQVGHPKQKWVVAVWNLFYHTSYLLAMITVASAYLAQISFALIGILAQSIVNQCAWCYYYKQQKIEICRTETDQYSRMQLWN